MTTTSTQAPQSTIPPPRRCWYLGILALSEFVTSFGAPIVATNLPAYAEAVGAGAFMIGLLIGVYDFAVDDLPCKGLVSRLAVKLVRVKLSTCACLSC